MQINIISLLLFNIIITFNFYFLFFFTPKKKQVRLTLRYIQDNQFPAVTVFRDNRPRYYQRDDMTGAWTLVRF